MRVLVVYWWPEETDMRVAVAQHLRALERGPDEVDYVNAALGAPARSKHRGYDAVVLHTTFLCMRWSSDFARHRRAWSWLAQLDCPKTALPQDEYDHAAVLDDWLDELGVDTVYSCFDAETRRLIYPRMARRARFAFALTGYVDAGVAAYMDERAQPHADRPYDVVYRALQLPYWFGSHGQLKHRIGLAVEERAQAHGLRTDISTRPEDTIFGPQWLDFLLSGRAVVGAESGSSVLDPRGEIQRRIRQLLAVDPELTFEEIDARMPAGWDSYAFFAISPRHFEAVLARTCQVLVEGSYSGVLEPGLHYIPVRRDLSDLDDALDRLRDGGLVAEMTARAYEDVYLNGAWSTDDFAAGLRETLRDAAAVPKQRRRRRPSALAPVRPFLTLRPMSRASSPAFAAARSLLVHPALALLLVRALASPAWRTVLHRDVARDLLRLGALDEFLRHQADCRGPWSVRAVMGECELVLTTERRADVPVGAGDMIMSTRSIVWDHSRFGSTASLDPSSPTAYRVGLGDGGRYRFEGLSRLAEAHPDWPWAQAITSWR